MPTRLVLLGLLAAVAIAGAGCGAEPERRFELRTPPERRYAEPLPEVSAARAAAAGDRVTRAEARRQRPVIAGWARALRRGDEQAAARYFALPALINQASPMRLRSRREARAFNAGLPCGARLTAVAPAGPYVVATFRLTRRPDNVCDAPGDTIRVGLIIRAGRFREFRQVPDTPGAERELAQGEDETPAAASRSQRRA